MANSNQKGKRVERAAAALLRDLGYEARRSQQYQGVVDDDGSADLTHNINDLRIEVKGGYNDAHLTSKIVADWIKRIEMDTPRGFRWVILWKKDRQPWLAITRMGTSMVNGMVVATTEVEMVLDYYAVHLGQHT